MIKQLFSNYLHINSKATQFQLKRLLNNKNNDFKHFYIKNKSAAISITYFINAVKNAAVSV